MREVGDASVYLPHGYATEVTLCKPNYFGELRDNSIATADTDCKKLRVSDQHIQSAGIVVKLVEPMAGRLGDVNCPELPRDRAHFGSGGRSLLNLKI